jgi:hypothetical protein
MSSPWTTGPLGLLLGVAAIILAVGLSAQAVTGAPSAPPAKRTLVTRVGVLKVEPGKSESLLMGCPTGSTAISGGWGVVEASFFYPLTAGITAGDNASYVFSVFVPNRLSAPGSTTAWFKVRAVCAKVGQPIVP